MDGWDDGERREMTIIDLESAPWRQPIDFQEKIRQVIDETLRNQTSLDRSTRNSIAQVIVWKIESLVADP